VSFLHEWYWVLFLIPLVTAAVYGYVAGTISAGPRKRRARLTAMLAFGSTFLLAGIIVWSPAIIVGVIVIAWGWLQSRSDPEAMMDVIEDRKAPYFISNEVDQDSLLDLSSSEKETGPDRVRHQP
jgi:hypothetical protein